jgi:hypothetical protein
MPYRKSLMQVKFRLRQDILRKLEREAKRHDRSTNDEIARRLEESFTYGDWREEREQLLLAIRTDLATHPNPSATRGAFTKLENSAEEELQVEVMEELFPSRKASS